ncbi:MAG TPA: 16S rRNA (adenine(1518)-N(6)/adenine(1519)-N(6))-dimethyltransferase RsmA [Phycisphaerae bacterium]|nr:16S rRNA (adenine(1518)-N(6)/adenine(1519)-N(6))-dimethyltransferase RsmA [Phycisphaerae bacterium]
MNRGDIRTFLEQAGLGPQHRLGQHFMMDQNILDQIVTSAKIEAGDLVLEIGPGPGNLTSRLAAKAAAVLAVELDAALLAAARQWWRQLNNVHWMQADALSGKHAINPLVIQTLGKLAVEHQTDRYKLAANLPYNAASPLVADLLIHDWHTRRGDSIQPRLDCLAFTVQWEVAQRMAAPPGNRDYGALGILIQLLADVTIVRSIAPGCFWPPPKVRSALVVIRPVQEKMRRIDNLPRIQKMLTSLFSHRRQNLANAIRHGCKPQDDRELLAKISSAGFNLKLRPEALAPPEFAALSKILQQDTSLQDGRNGL